MGGKMRWVGVLIFILFLIGCAPQKDTVTIGAIAPLTGPVSFFGESIREGYDVALEEINAAGGINGKQVALIYEDDQCDTKLTTNAFLKFIQFRPDMILGPFCGTNSKIVADLAEEHKQFVIAPGDNFGKLNEYYFSVRYPIFLEGRLSADIAHDLGAKKVGVIYYDNDWGQQLLRDFTSRLEELGGEVTVTEGVIWNTVDVRTPLLKIAESGADTIYVQYFSGNVYRQMDELGIDLIKVGTFEIEHDDTLEVAGAAANDVYYAFPGMPEDQQNEVQKKFFRAYQEKYDKIPDGISRDSYDALKITADALRSCEVVSNECLLNYVKSLKEYQGASGPLTFNEELWAFDKPFSRKMIKDEQFVFVETIGPKVVIS